MGKSSKYPAYSTGAVSVNGNTIANTSKVGNTVTSNYNMSDAEKNLYNYAQNSMMNYLPNIDAFSDEARKNINSQLEAYKNRAVQSLDNIYNPMINNLKSDIASRFGNLNNSAFLDKLNSIENNRALAMSDLAQGLEAQRSNLYNNELSNRYDYLNFLNLLQNQINNNALNYIQAALSNSNSGNSYNQAAYRASNQADLFNMIPQIARIFF